MNLFDYVRRRAEETPDRTGLVFEDGRIWSYAELERESARAAAVWERLGVRPGDRVGLYLQNSPELAFALLGAWRLGAVAVTINVMYRAEELEHALGLTAPVALIADDRNLDVLAALHDHLPSVAVTGRGEGSGEWPGYDALAASVNPVATVFEPGEDDESAILFTGGTTGSPKAVRTTHSGWVSALETLAHASRGRPGPYPLASPETPPNLVAFPLFHSGGQQAFLFAFVVGRTVLLMERFTVDRVVELVERYRLDNLFLLPTMLYDLVSAEKPVALDSVRSVLVSGQALNLALRRRFEEQFHIPILQNYGSTEVGHVAGWTGADLRAGLWKPGSVGRVYPGVEVEIRNESHAQVPSGEIGEVCVKTNVAKGYVSDGGDEELIVRDGWVYTQDMGYIDEDDVLFVVGRSRDLIKCGGFQIWPAEIEEALLRHPLVREVAVTGCPDERLGEIPVAFVVPAVSRDTVPDDATEQLIAHSRAHLAVFKAVREVFFVDALPRSDAGKVKRADLLDLRPHQPGNRSMEGVSR